MQTSGAAAGTATWLAIIALLISMLSLMWNVFNTFFRLPRIHVALSKSVHIYVHMGDEPTGRGSPPEYTFYVTAINTGGEAATMTDAGLLTPEGATVISIEQKRMEGVKIEGPKLPARLDAHGVLTWKISGDLLVHIEDGVAFYAYARKYRPIRRWPRRRRNQHKFHKSPLAEMKGSPRRP